MTDIRRAVVPLALALALALLIVPASASATIWLQGAGNQVYVTAAIPGPEDDDVTVSVEVGPPAMYVFTDPAGVTVFSPCVLRSPTEGACPASGRIKMTVELGNGRNRFAAELSDAGEGFDLRNVFVGGGRSRDVIDLRGLPSGTPFARALSGGGPDLLIGGPARIDHPGDAPFSLEQCDESALRFTANGRRHVLLCGARDALSPSLDDAPGDTRILDLFSGEETSHDALWGSTRSDPGQRQVLLVTLP